jgi:hypothetical protein
MQACRDMFCLPSRPGTFEALKADFQLGCRRPVLVPEDKFVESPTCVYLGGLTGV